MKVFVTGGHGYIGTSVVEALVKQGHQVTAMIKNPEQKQYVEQKHARAEVGDINNLQDMLPKMLEHDAVIHCAFDYSRGQEAERKTADTFIQLMQKAGQQNKKFACILTSGCMVLGNCQDQCTEDSKLDVPPGMKWRHELEMKLCQASRRAAIVRPAFVWGKVGSHGLKALQQLKEKGTVDLIGGENNCARTPWIHVDDLGMQYALLIEKLANNNGEQFGGMYNFVDGRESISHRDIWKAFLQSVSKVINQAGRLQPVSVEDARKTMGDFADCMVLKQGHVLADKVKKLGWSPTHGTPLEEMDQWTRDLVRHDAPKQHD